MPATILMCADPLNPGRPDAHFRPAARAVRDSGGTVALFDHDALQRGETATAVRRVPRDLGPMWYRGWMVTPDEYTALAAALAERGSPLAVSPDRYQSAHELPGWYDTFAELTPPSVWLPLAPHQGPDPAALARLVRSLRPGPAVVKDYVKSRKHEWHEACFVPDMRDTDRLHRVVARLVELAGDFLAGGIVVREFEAYDGTGEVRVWWIDGEPVLVGAHPDTPETLPGDGRRPDLTAVGAAVTRLDCRFVTTDLARRTDGDWRVVEVGDAQVSDLPRSVDPATLLARLPAVPGPPDR